VKRYSRVEDVVTIGSHPLLIPPIRAEHCYPAAAAAVRQSGYLPYIGGPWALRARLTAGLPLSRRRSASACENDPTNLEASSL
jgi:hypothetical protein